jgi:hypothetical protein
MKNLFNRLTTLLLGTGRARTPGRTDWHGRPLGESTVGTTPATIRYDGGPYTSFRLASVAAMPAHAANRNIGSDILRTRISCPEAHSRPGRR